MLDLTRQLADFGAHLDAEHPTPEVAAIVAEAERRERHPDGEVTWPLEEYVPARRLEPLPVRGPRRRWVAAVAAAAAVLVLVGGIGLLARLFRPGPDVTEPTTTTVAPTTTLPDLEPGEFLGAAEWQLVTGADGGFGGAEWLHGAAAFESGFLMWGIDEGAGTLWFSSDGMSWLEVLRQPDAWFGDVVDTPQGLLAFGLSPCADGSCTSAPTIWASADGTTWEVTQQFEEPRHCCGFSEVERAGSRLVALAGDVARSSDGGVSAGCGPSSCEIESWTSDDGGATWSMHPFLGGPAQLFDLVAADTGLVAVGTSWAGNPEGGSAAVWYSVDGEAWTTVENPGGPTEMIGVINAVAAGGPGFVAVGAVENTASVWTSPDGSGWTLISPVESVFGGLQDVATLPSGSLVAVGRNCDAAEVPWNCGAGVWNSADGVSWLRAPYAESVLLGGAGGGAQMGEVAAGPLGVLAVGSADVEPGAASWFSKLSVVAPGEPASTTTAAPNRPPDDPVSAADVGSAITVDGEPRAIAFGEGAVWVSNGTRDSDEGPGSGALSRIDPATNTVAATIEMGTRVYPGEGEKALAPHSIAAGDGSVWVGSDTFGLVRRLDPATMQFTGEWVEVGWPANVAVGDSAVWALGFGDNGDYGEVFELDARGAVLSETTVAMGLWYGLAAGGGAVWPVIFNDAGVPAVVKIDAESREVVATISLFPADPMAGFNKNVAFGEGSLWAIGGNAAESGGLLLRIDPETAEIVESIRLDMWPTSMEVGEGRVWVLGWVGEEEKQIHVIDAATNAVIGGPIVFEQLPSDMALGGGSLWTSHADAGTVTRIDLADIPPR